MREPFLHFILLGVTMFVAGHCFEDRSRITRITITQDQIRRLSDKYRLQYGEYPSSKQIEAMEDRLIEEEIFYREALKLGLDANDEIVRRRLVQKYEFLQQDLAIPAEPAEAQLVEYYGQHLDRYRQPQTVTFSHIYFSPDGRGENEAHRAAKELTSYLNRHGLSGSPDLGDRFPGSHSFTAVSRDDLGSLFGREGFTEQIFKIEPGHWIGPVRSGLGWHAVYVSDHEPPRQIPFDKTRDDVRRDYIETERERRNASLLAKLRQDFQVVRE